jgi:hypothetical protein
MQINVWIQLFFDDGSVSEGKRIPTEVADDPEKAGEVAKKLLKGLNRQEGFALIWGAGEIGFYKISVCPLEGSDSLVWETWTPWSQGRKNSQ